MTTTCRCGRPTGGARLCSNCTRTLAFAIANVAGHYTDLGTVARRQTRYAGSATKGSIGKAQPLPVDMRFVSGPPRLDVFGGVGGSAASPGSQLRWDTWNTVVAWSRTVMEERPEVEGPTCEGSCLHTTCHAVRLMRWPANTITSMCLYLDKQHRWIESQAWVEDLLDELLDLEQRLVRMVNRPPDRWYAGKCSSSNVLDPDNPEAICTVDLYAEVDKGFTTCPGCETRHDVTERREILLAEAQDYLVTATEAAGALLAWTDYDGSETKLVDRIRKWRDRLKLEVADVTSLQGKDRHLYRLGDIQQLLVEHAQSEQRRRIAG